MVLDTVLSPFSCDCVSLLLLQNVPGREGQFTVPSLPKKFSESPPRQPCNVNHRWRAHFPALIATS